MKKMININFQGRIIPIEETSFEILKNYIESLRMYFAREEGRDEIINDIESRIAELFSERLNSTVCITDEDVNNIIAGMGRPEDFEEAEATGNYNMPGTPPAPGADSRPAEEPKVWRRSLNDRILGGVCAGIANYLKVDPAIIRILFAIIAVGSFGTWFLAYLILWVILPGKIMTPNARKRLYRSSEHKVIGGVGGGLAAYFATDIWVPRLIFVAPLLINITGAILDLDPLAAIFGGLMATFVVIYIILWIILPQARSASARLEMKGEKVNLQSIKNTVQEDPGVIIQPREGRLGRAIGVIFKAFFLFIAGIIALSFITAFVAIVFGSLVGGSGLYPFKDFIIESPAQNVLLWCSLILFLAVPGIALLTWFIRRIMGVRSKKHYLAYIFGSLWVLGIISASVLVATVMKNFRVKETVEETLPMYYPVNGKLNVKVSSDISEYSRLKRKYRKGLPLLGKNGDSLFLNHIRINIIKSNDTAYHVHKLMRARGKESQVATAHAMNIQYPVFQMDTNLVLPQGFSISSKDKFRNQQVEVVVEVPVGKKVQVNDNRSFSWFEMDFDDVDVDDSWRWKYRWRNGVEYVMTEDGLKKTDHPD